MSSRKLLVRLLALWLLASTLVATYALIIVAQTNISTWIGVFISSSVIDVVFGIVTIMMLMRLTTQPPIWLTSRLLARLVSWACLALAVLTGILWLSPPFVGQSHFFRHNLIYSLIQQLGNITLRSVWQLRQTYQTGAELPMTTLAQLALACLAWGMAALTTALAGRVAWKSLQPIISSQLDALHVRFPRLPIRSGRWLAWLHWLSVAGLFLGLIGSGLAIADNTTIPQSRWQSMTTGPDVPPTVRALVLNRQDGALYAGTDDGVVFRSADGGVSWRAASEVLTNATVWALALDERSGTLYAGIDGGVFRSADSGTSWQAASAGLTNTSVRALTLDERSGTLYSGTSGAGVFRSTDGGVSWQAASAGLTNIYLQKLELDRRNGTLYAGTDGGVFRSTDGGVSWQAASTGLTNISVRALALDERNGTLYAGTSGAGVFRSTDGGVSWQAASAGLTNTSVWALALDERSDTLYAGAWGGVFRSTDGGVSWQAASAGLTNTSVWALALDERSGTLYSGTFGAGVFRSTDGGVSWQAASAGLTNTSVWALALDEQSGTLYAGTNGGVFRSTDSGVSWQAASAGLTNTSVWALALDERSGTLYVGTWGGGVFRSTDGGVSWQAASAGLTNTSMRALALDERSGTLYTGIDGGVFSSIDGGVSWQAANAGLTNTSVWALALDAQSGTLYAGTNGGVFRSTDGGTSWQAASAGLTNTSVRALALDARSSTLYTGTNGGVFRSTDSGTSWQAASAGLTNTYLRALALDERSSTLYAGTWGGGVFRSADGGVSWQAASAGLTNTSVWALALDERSGTLYVGTWGGGVFRSIDGGVSWQAASAGLTDTYLQALALDERSGTLYAGAWGGVFRSTDGGTSWQAASAGLTANSVLALALDRRDGILYASTDVDVFRSTDGGSSWQIIPVALSVYPLPDFIFAQHSYGVVSRVPDGAPVWATYGGGAFWASLAAGLGLHQAAIQPLSEGNAYVLAAWGATLARTELEPGYRRIPLAWLALRALVWRITTWSIVNSRLLAVALALAAVLALTFTYANLARPFGIPLWATVLARRRLDAYARPAALDNAWPDWEQAVRSELLRYGDATADDLRRVPGPFRRYALRRYGKTYDQIQTLEASPGRLRLLAGDRLLRWHAAWYVSGKELGMQPGLRVSGWAAVDVLAKVLAEALGLTIDPPRDFEAVRAYRAEAPALRLKIPPRFPLVFVADSEPGARTVQMLVDAVDVLKETGYFALVVPLEPLVRKLDIAAGLRQAVTQSPHVQDFIVLSQDDVLDIMIARHPTQALVQHILAQVDLTVVSPFVVSGPVPETMFFGREAEVRTLVENATIADFAVVGNRKIGKTSLLQRARARLAAGRRVRPLLVDCQTVRDKAGFLATFQAQTGLELPTATPEGLATILTKLRRDGLPLVLLLDEVDALLADEKAHGEPLAATWRALAQAGVCRFVFCGSTGLARRLDDPHSVFFNFPQLLSLGYLPPETARLVLTQPLETLGIVLENTEALLDDVLALTSGHPNLIQYLGQGLVQAANQRGERRIPLADLAALRTSTGFTEYYLKTVWGEAGPLEKLITLIAPPSGFQLGELEAALVAHDVRVSEEALDTALKLLRIYAILEKQERTYTFVPRAFPEILHRTQEVERLITQEKRRLATGGV